MSTKELAIQIRMPYASRLRCYVKWHGEMMMEAIRRKDASNVARKIREIYVPKEEIDDSKLCDSLTVI